MRTVTGVLRGWTLTSTTTSSVIAGLHSPSPAITELRNGGRARGGKRRVSKEVGGHEDKENQRKGGECPNPNKLADHGWVGLRRAAVFLSIRGSGSGSRKSKCA